MPAQKPTDDLLIKYLLNEVSAEELAAIAEWLAADHANLQHFQAFEKVWLLTQFTDSSATINVDDEWAIFKKRTTENVAKAVTHNQAGVYQLNTTSTKKTHNSRYKLFVAAAVAASIITIVFIGKFFVGKQENQTTNIVAANTHKPNAAFVLRHETNTTGKAKKVLLQDGTVVLLEDRSEVSFTEPFADNYRSVALKGKANFKVAKDKTRPFTVFSDAIATTVLGTVFDVSAYPQNATITVRLYEGKVVVNPAISGPKKLQQSVYLSPGYEMVYNKQSALARVQSFGSIQPTTTTHSSSPATIDNPNIPRKKGSWYMFNNQPLSQVFDQLKEMYNADIQYRKKDVQKLYFIGQFNKEDSLETILSQIALTNNLTVTKSNNTFVITRK